LSRVRFCTAGSNGDYIKDALAGKTSNGDDDHLLNGHGSHSDASGDDDDASEAGVDDAGARFLAVEATKAYLAANPAASDKEISDFVTNQQMASALKSQERIYIAVHAVFTPDFFKSKEAHKFAPLLSRVANGNRIMERHMIGALESLCADKPKNFAVLVKQLYDEDALDEETILEWADEGRSEYTRDEVDEETRAALRAEAEPVVVWLQEADSDDDDDEDED
jgi:translation initiation factor 5